MRKALVGATLSAMGIAGSLAGASSAQALFTPINEGRLDWYVTCKDGPYNTLQATPRLEYNVPTTGYYQTRVVLYRANDTQYQLGPLVWGQNWAAGSTHTVPSFRFIDPTDMAQYQVTAFVWRWNGSSYQLIARESKSCSG